MNQAAGRRWQGVALMLPLAGVLAESVHFTVTCDYDCGDAGGRGLFLLLLLCTPPAAVGVLLLAPGGQRSPRLVRIARRLAVVTILLCTLILIGATLAALGEGVDNLTTEPQIHQIGQTEPSAYDRAQQREAGIWWLVIASVLGAMSAAAVLALRAAWHKRR